jgi:hypothetical protein
MQQVDMKTSATVLAILYGKGGLGDVGRHAILAAFERNDVASVKVFSQHPESLQENYKCGCLNPHNLTVEQRKRIDIIPVKHNWKDDLSAHFVGWFHGRCVMSWHSARRVFVE